MEKSAIIFGILLSAFVSTTIIIEYAHENVVTAKIVSVSTQQHTQGNKEYGFYTKYKYLVATDKGTLQISPDGLFSCPQFGALKEGKTYRFQLRGYSIPLIGLYPYIIEAKEEE